jgi:hypothetical protein
MVRKDYFMVRSTITTREVYFDDWKTVRTEFVHTTYIYVHSYTIEEVDGSGEPVQGEGHDFP